jgi:uncharacterized membrane protein
LFGFLFWRCIVMWKKRNRQRPRYNDFELDPVVACIANSHHLEQSMCWIWPSKRIDVANPFVSLYI